MAPEVAKELPYNKSVDAYSFGIMLHELLSAEKPFFGFSAGKHMSLVVLGGERPKMDHRHTSCWPMNLQWLMKRCWSPFPTSRPTFAVIRETLQAVLDDKDDVPDISTPAGAVVVTEVEPPPAGFASLLRPKRAQKGSKSFGSSTSMGSSSDPTEAGSTGKQQRQTSWAGWMFPGRK